MLDLLAGDEEKVSAFFETLLGEDGDFDDTPPSVEPLPRRTGYPIALRPEPTAMRSRPAPACAATMRTWRSPCAAR